MQQTANHKSLCSNRGNGDEKNNAVGSTSISTFMGQINLAYFLNLQFAAFFANVPLDFGEVRCQIVN